MSNELLEQLEAKIDETIETIELMRMQIEELENHNINLKNENVLLKNKQNHWGKILQNMLEKLNSTEYSNEAANLEVCDLE